eukprot:8875382-Pyramimonas_sp.AAC.1
MDLLGPEVRLQCTHYTTHTFGNASPMAKRNADGRETQHRLQAKPPGSGNRVDLYDVHMDVMGAHGDVMGAHVDVMGAHVDVTGVQVEVMGAHMHARPCGCATGAHVNLTGAHVDLMGTRVDLMGAESRAGLRSERDPRIQRQRSIREDLRLAGAGDGDLPLAARRPLRRVPAGERSTSLRAVSYTHLRAHETGAYL